MCHAIMIGERVSARPDDFVLPFVSPRRPDVSPTAAGILLGSVLRSMRERRKVTMKAAAKTINASVSKVSRLERGDSPPDVRDVADLAKRYGATAEERNHLQFLARRANEPEWFHRYLDYTASWMRRLIGLESQATELTTFEVKIVPGLLQTEEYARQVIVNGLRVSDGEAVQQRVCLRGERQERFFGQNEPPRATFLLDEAVLYRQVGSRETMRQQLVKLRELAADEPNVRIRFVPFDSTVVSNHGSMTHLIFGTAGPAPMVYVEGHDDATYVTKREDVERHVELLLRLSEEAAASRRVSNDMLLRAIERYSD
ncbi:helix-turn-helix transcriptional regulator [Streptomyces sp. TRM 70351]|uniref:helix-turn-helix domain-containing protein n=1 Tax=Streptomyces sp. TRM 70351 TaxID=3116552 RepID=UPI002E7BF870|nr:helix-turn-helix transcriptional regulator [Streptomyces sp. TRM 70351]MEE1931337.1 helix-turn-helix transcriptional regulator [Streptomyces sp. TRM 70351]